MQPTTLSAFPNPFVYLDHEGQPAGTFPFDPDHGGTSRRWVGARIDLSPATDGKPKTRAIPRPWDQMGKVSHRVDGKIVTSTTRVGSASDQRTVFAHEVESPHILPNVEHYVRGVRSGDLIPADAATAGCAGLTFVEPVVALRAAAARAVDSWVADHGSPPPIASWPPALRALAEEVPAAVEEPIAPPVEPDPANAAPSAITSPEASS